MEKSFNIIVSLLILLLFISYYPSLFVPFYLDDRTSITENQILVGSIRDIWQAFTARFFAYLSFSLNLKLFGENPFSFHVFNFILHLINGLLIYKVAKILSSIFQNTAEKKQRYIALAIAFVWLLHPLNTQAVTYIVQRIAEFATLFYLLVLYGYLKWKKLGKHLYGIFVITFLMIGLFTKQNFVVIFPTLFVLEFLLGNSKTRKWLTLLTVFMVLIWALMYPFIQGIVETLNNLSRETQAISRYDYFCNQLIILWQYIGKFFWPFNLRLNLDNTLIPSNSPIVFMAFVGHISLMLLATYVKKRIPLFFVGIILFYLGHSVESFIIPIIDIAFEHRTYLPNIGLSIAVVSLLHYLLSNRYFYISLSIILVTFTILTFVRNSQWQNPKAFFTRELEISPNNPRTQASLAIELLKENTPSARTSAAKLLIDSVNTNFKQGKVTVSSINNLLLVLFEEKKYAQGIAVASKALRYVTKPKDRSTILTSIAYGYIKMGWCDFALGLAKKAIKLDSNNIKAKNYVESCNKMAN